MMKKMNNAIMKFLPLVLCITLCLCAVTSTVAWVVTNRKTRANDMTVHIIMPRGVFATTHPNVPASFNSNTWDSYDFTTTVGITSDRILNPVSSVDAEHFYLPSDVLANGTVNTDVTGDWFVLLDDAEANEYIIDQTFYLCNTYTQDITLRLSNVTIACGSAATSSGSDLYKAVRCAVVVNGVTTQFRVTEGTNNYGAANPVNGVKSVGTDASIPAGDQSAPYITLTLPKAVPSQVGQTTEMTMYTKSIRVIIWIEGQNDNAVATYAGTAFRVSLTLSDSP